MMIAWTVLVIRTFLEGEHLITKKFCMQSQTSTVLGAHAWLSFMLVKLAQA